MVNTHRHGLDAHWTLPRRLEAERVAPDCGPHDAADKRSRRPVLKLLERR